MKYTNNYELWSAHLRQAGWKGSIYQLWWDSGSEYGRKRATPLGYVPIINKLNYYPHWRMVVKRAKITGSRYLSSIISSIPENCVSLIGYSLGCRVIYYGLQEYKTSLSTTLIDDVVLLAGAIRTIGWENIAIKTTGDIYNFYNRNDSVLNEEFRHYGIYKYKPCGVCPIKTRSENCMNIDITKLINTRSHDIKKYLSVFSQCNRWD